MIDFVKKVIGWLKSNSKVVILVAALLLVLVNIITFSQLKKAVTEVDRYKLNEKALVKECDDLKNKSQVYEFTINQLEYLNDSITIKMNNVIKELGIQKKKLEQIQYVEKITEVHDSIFFKDTIFVAGVGIDTTLTDNKWYSIDLNLEYPGTVSVSPKFSDEIFIVMESKRETVDTPSKIFFVRWFQKKHTVVETTVVNNNPYSTTQNSRFINIIK